MTKFPTYPVLLVDDEETWLRSFSLALKSHGIDNILCCNDSTKVTGILAGTEVEVMAVDLAMPGLSGEEIIDAVSTTNPDIPILVITGMSQVETAVQCIKRGAFDFFVKTNDKSSLVSGIRHAIEIRELKRENSSLRTRFLQDTLERPEAFAPIMTCSKAMRSVFQYIEAIARSTQPVLITGESGVGKELVAKVIHDLSGRQGEFVPVNVAGLDDNIFADTLFGHKKGAFTGADRARPGLVENAKAGTLFLDEIGDLPQASQVKLLRLVQEREYLPIGSDVTRKTDARIIAATNVDPDGLGEPERFRSDLYYRLRAHHVHLPPLRERREDLPLLVDHFLRQGCQGRRRPNVPAGLLPLLAGHSFPGNIRELQFLILDALSCTSGDELDMERIRAHIDKHPRAERKAAAGEGTRLQFGPELPTLKRVCAELVQESMRRTGGNQALAAAMLGVSRQALNKRLIKLRRGRNDDA
jgi:DNA-binding NtrC family response regulator